MRALVMGVLNVTPDSFSDGGQYLDPVAAVAHGRRLIAEGADVVDVGGESTRPGAEPVTTDEEIRRVVGVVAELAPEVRVSIDTRHAVVAEAAVAAGATLINDVSASLHEVAAAAGVGWVAMHMQGQPGTMQTDPHYDDVVQEVRDHLVARADSASSSGVTEIWIDPGIGFGKTIEHNLDLLAHLEVLVATGWPVVVGSSRKSTLGLLLADSDGRARRFGGDAPLVTVPVEDRLEASLATATWAMAQGAGMIRAHDVRATAQAARVVQGEIAA